MTTKLYRRIALPLLLMAFLLTVTENARKMHGIGTALMAQTGANSRLAIDAAL